MNRFCSGLLTVFRALQLLLSLAALGCGAYITYTMFSMSSSAKNIQTSIEGLINDSATRIQIEADLDITDDALVTTALTDLEDLLTPLLHLLEGFPTRAIVVSGVSIWSICFIIYLYIAQKSTQHPNLNKRSYRLLLESLTLLHWIAGIICSILLALEYGGILFTGGIELKAAWSVVREVIGDALKDLIEGDNIIRELDIVNDLFTIGALSILAVVASSICGIVSIISLLVSCCISGKPKQKRGSTDSEAATFLPVNPSSPQMEKKGVTNVSVYEMSPSSMMTMTPPTPASIQSWSSPTANQYRPHNDYQQQQHQFPIPKYHYPQRYQPINQFNQYEG